jgi:phage protein D
MPKQGLLVPEFEVIINGKPLDGHFELAGVTVDDSLDIPGMFVLEFNTSDAQASALIDLGQFDVGSEVEVKMGYAGDSLTSVMTGEITGLEPVYQLDRLPSLIVRGYDCRHRLQRGRKVRSFAKHKDSEIAQKLAQEAGLSAQVKDSGVTHDYVIQSNQTDMEFLQERALRIGFEMKVQGKRLIFQPVANDKSPDFVLTFGDSLIEFYPRLSSVGQVGDISVQAWDPKNKTAITGKASKSEVSPVMGGGKSGATLASSAFGQATGLVTDIPVSSQGEADQISKALINAMSLAWIVGEGACVGRPDLTAGTVIKLDGLGRRFSGPYYVTAVSHRYNGEGYLTHFTVRRNAS